MSEQGLQLRACVREEAARLSLPCSREWPTAWATCCNCLGLASPWCHPCHRGGWAGRPGGCPGPLQMGSPQPPLPPPQMTAWAHSNWTRGPTSPSSPTRPASASEQRRRRHHRTQAATTAGGCLLFFYFAFFVCVPILHVLTPISSFFLQPSAKLDSVVPGALPPGSCPALAFAPRPGCERLSAAFPRIMPSARGKILIFNYRKPQ